MNNTEPPTNYADAISAQQFPTKDQAILIEALNNVQIKEYIAALSLIISPTLIRFASRISNNRICIYLANKTTAQELVEVHRNITVHNTTLPTRPLISQNKRIVLSNVPPFIPHKDIEVIIKSLNVNTVSPITFLRAGLNEPEWTHIMSFRRQVYINPADIDKLPDSLKMTVDETAYYIYISTDTQTCFHCKKEGHLAKHCPKPNTIPHQTPDSQGVIREPTPPTMHTIKPKNAPRNSTTLRLTPLTSNPQDTYDSIEEIASCSLTTNTTRPTKRLPSASPSDSPTHDPETLEFEIVKGRHRNKKKTRNSPTPNNKTTTTQLKEIEAEMAQNSAEYPLKFIELQNFLEKAYGTQNPMATVREFSLSPIEIITMLRKLYHLLPDKGSKNRTSRLITKLAKDPETNTDDLNSPIPWDDEIYDSESSTSSTMDGADGPFQCT